MNTNTITRKVLTIPVFTGADAMAEGWSIFETDTDVYVRAAMVVELDASIAADERGENGVIEVWTNPMRTGTIKVYVA
jgi:hypothetical protein